jgi:hypothetical protein
MCSGTFGVDNSLWNTLTCKMGEFVEKIEVLKENWTTRSSSKGVLIVIKGSTG